LVKLTIHFEKYESSMSERMLTVCDSSPGTGIPHGIRDRCREIDKSGRPLVMNCRTRGSKTSGRITMKAKTDLEAHGSTL